MSNYYLTRDLFFGSQVTSAADRVGRKLQMIGSVDQLLADAADGECGSVFIDLSLPGLNAGPDIARLRERFPQARLVAYAPHVHEQLMLAAGESGCDEVLSRGQFHSQFQRLVEQLEA